MAFRVARAWLMAPMVRWFRHRLQLLESSTAIRLYGACLAGIHLLTYVQWTATGWAARVLTGDSPMCWPFFESCAALPRFSEPLLQSVLWVYALGALGALFAFLQKRRAALAFALLIAVSVCKGALFVLDYRAMGNYHYMPFVVSVLYLAWPNPQRTIPAILVAFYLSAGALKLNREWLSGAALVAPTWLSGKWLELGCAYVALLELVFVLGLWSSRPWLRWLTLAQLLAFHAYSWHVVGFFYPCVMALLLAYYPLYWREVGDEDFGELLATGKAGPAVYLSLALYAAAQVAPSLFPGDSAITGEGRLFALNMMDARVECDHVQLVRIAASDHTLILESSVRRADVGLRIRCDPIRFWNIAHSACRDYGPLDNAVRVDAYLNARRTTDPVYQSVFAVEDFCVRARHFSVWSHNRWLEPRR